ncbi:nuclear transport factor 2 family protein [Novosphingobium sp. M1R2S20]|uniref:Nuclear transport factor 2 family protein n=1 Tax=Novosphingobium rhizovicinum TaxID=3228928 RepID=A0ABV3RBF7_9SPHN
MADSAALGTPEDQIRKALAEYCHHTDTGDYDRWVGLFVEDGAFHMFGRSHVGHPALRAFIEDDQPPHRRGLHLTTDSVIELEGGTAKVLSNFIFIASGDSAAVVVAAGRYHDVLVSRNGRWLFQEREAVLVGPTATQNWGAKGFENPDIVPWFAVTRATPAERRGGYGDSVPADC